VRCLALALAAIVLLAACGGDDGESNATPASSLTPTSTPSSTVSTTASAAPTVTRTPLPSPTVPVTAPPGLRLCLADELSVANVGAGAATGTVYTNYGINNNGYSPCALPGPPELRFEDLAGADLAIEYRHNLPCPSNSGVECLLYGKLALAATELTPSPRGPAASAVVVVAIANTSNYPPCASPNVFASTLVFTFPEVGELRVPLDGREFQQCEAQVTVFSFK